MRLALEQHPRGQLDLTLIVFRYVRRSEGGAGNLPTWTGKSCVIEDIEELGPQLKLRLVNKGGVFGY
jgi:hypothetical protein